MIRLIRIFGLLMIGAGAVVIASYLIEPLRVLWAGLLKLSLPIVIGLAAAAAGFLLLLATLLWERLEERGLDRELRTDKPETPASHP